VHHVGRGHHDPAAGTEHASALAHEARLVFEMLDTLAREQGVEGAGAKRQRRVAVGADPSRGRRAGRRRIKVGRDNFEAHPLKPRRLAARAGRNIEQASALHSIE
jgi:hypothetical protein